MQLDFLIEKYRAVINELAPPGEAISRHKDSNWQKWFTAVATVFAKLHQCIEDVVIEWNPLFTVTRFEDWEASTTGPYDCGTYTGTMDERRARILAKMRLVAGGMDGGNGSAAAISYLEAVAARAGYDVTIEKTDTCVLGITINSYNGGVACLPRLYGEPYGELYGDCGYALLACIFDKVAPARYTLNFIWPE